VKKILSVVLLVCSCFLISATDPSCSSAPNSRVVAQRVQEQSAQTALQSVSIPDVSYFQERRTVAKWISRWDKPNIPTYVYLISFGKVLGYYVADGKPASTKSYLMPEEKVAGDSYGRVTVSTPDIDGTYGENNPGIRFFTAEGVAVEWAGSGASYLYSDAPIDFGYEVPRLKIRGR
jgi:hypothetical protein